MIKLDIVAKELFSKIRGRFPNVTIGDGDGNVVSVPEQARFFEFPFLENNENGEKISISLSEDEGVVVMYFKQVAENSVSKSKWFDFLKELRVFSKKRMLNFNTRDITKSNLEKRDYKYLAGKPKDNNMNESKLYGTSRVSYQDFDSARLMIKHTESVNQELATGRTQKIGAIYVESNEGERFKYPYKHLSGARAMARHVAEGGKPFDDFGKHITSLSEELSKLRKFKTYMGRSAVMAESLSGYVDVVKERIATVKKTVESLQKQKTYKEAFETFETPVFEDVPDDVKENWIDQLTIKQFNEELSDVFPYIYKLVSEATRATELGPEDLLGEAVSDCDETCPKSCPDCGGTGDPEKYKKDQEVDEAHGNSKEYDKCWDGYKKVPGKKRGEKGSCVKEEDEIEAMIEKSMGQFAEAEECEDCGCTPCECETTDESNAFAKAVQDAKRDGKKKGDKVKGPDGDEITLEKEQKTPLGEFILSYFDRENGAFPKGETAVLTMVEKDYGEEFIEPAKPFTEKVPAKFEEWQMRTQPQQMEAPDTGEYDRMRELAGLR